MNRKIILSLLPALLILLISSALWWRLRSTAIDARQQAQELRGRTSSLEAVAHLTESEQSELVSPSATDVSLAIRLDDVLGEIDRHERRLVAAKKLGADLAAEVVVPEDELLTSYGRIQDMGLETGELINMMFVMALGAEALSEEQEDKFDDKAATSYLKLVTWMPQVAQMESHPEEVAAFQSSALGGFFKMEEAARTSLEALIEKRFIVMKEDGYTMEQRPAEGENVENQRAAWREGRARALSELMLEIKPLLPAARMDEPLAKGMLPAILNMGIGIQSQQIGVDTRSAQAAMGLPAWPIVPW